MKLEFEYKVVHPFSFLIPSGIEFVTNNGIPFDVTKRPKSWKLKDGVKPEDVGLIEIAQGLWTGLFYEPNSPKGLVKDKDGKVVRLPFYVTQEELDSVNLLPTDKSTPEGTKSPVPSPHRKLTENEQLMLDTPFSGYMVVDITTVIPQATDKISQILNTVLLIKEFIMEKDKKNA